MDPILSFTDVYERMVAREAPTSYADLFKPHTDSSDPTALEGARELDGLRHLTCCLTIRGEPSADFVRRLEQYVRSLARIIFEDHQKSEDPKSQTLVFSWVSTLSGTSRPSTCPVTGLQQELCMAAFLWGGALLTLAVTQANAVCDATNANNSAADPPLTAVAASSPSRSISNATGSTSLAGAPSSGAAAGSLPGSSGPALLSLPHSLARTGSSSGSGGANGAAALSPSGAYAGAFSGPSGGGPVLQHQESTSGPLAEALLLLRTAAGVFGYLANDLCLRIQQQSPSADKVPELTSGLCKVMSLLCLGTAQAVMAQRSAQRANSPSLTASLYEGAAALFEDAAKAYREHTLASTSGQTTLATTANDRLKRFLAVSAGLHSASAYKALAEALLQGGQAGQAEAAARECASVLKSCSDAVGETDARWQAHISSLLISTEASRLRYERERNTVYYQGLASSPAKPPKRIVVSPVEFSVGSPVVP